MPYNFGYDIVIPSETNTSNKLESDHQENSADDCENNPPQPKSRANDGEYHALPRESQRRFKLDAVDAINKSLKVRFTKNF